MSGPAIEELTGNLDAVSPEGHVLGWCFSPTDPDSRRVLAVEVDGREVTTVVADQRRADLLAAGMGDGLHAFALELPPAAMRPRPHGPSAVVLRDVATGLQVGQTAFTAWLDAAAAPEPAHEATSGEPVLAGSLDGITQDGWVSGWCWYPARPEARVDLVVCVDEVPAGEVCAAQFRADLRDAGVGDGAHGFSFALPWPVLANKGSVTVSVRDRATRAPLGGPATLRLGGLTAAEERIDGLERQLRMLRLMLAEALRQREASDEHAAARELFRTVGTFFQELADAPRDRAGPEVATGLRGAVADIFARLPPFTLERPASPAATICVDADVPLDTLYACMASLHAAGADAVADIVLIDDGSNGAAMALLPSVVRNLLYVRDTGPHGRLAARAEASRTARGRILVVLAGCLRVDASWLPTMLGTLAPGDHGAGEGAGEAAALVGSAVVRDGSVLQHLGLIAGPGPRETTWHDVALGAPATGRAVSYVRRVDAVADYAFAVRLDALDAAGGFDLGFARTGSAMLDLCLRLRRAGHAILAQPKAQARWLDAIAGDAAFRIEAARGSPDPEQPDEDVVRIRHAMRTAPPAEALYVGRALIVDTEIPRPDRDAGSVAAVEHMRLLRRLGYQVTFMAANEPAAADGAAADRLERLGIEVAGPPDTASVTALLEARGAGYDLAVLHRHGNASLLLDRVRAFAPRAKVVFCPCDLHFLREERERVLDGRPETEADRATRRAELASVNGADATIVYSDAELALLARETEPAKLHLLRWVARPLPRPPPFAARSGLCFVGNFRHAPNVDAVLWFAREIMPRLLAARPDIRCEIIGDAAPESVLSLASDNLAVAGWVEDLEAHLGAARVGIAPLRYGAGFKGKIASTLACGTPMVATGMALEGTGLSDGDGVSMADTPARFARAVLALIDDEARWSRLAERGRERCAALYSPEAGLRTYAALLASLGLDGTIIR